MKLLSDHWDKIFLTNEDHQLGWYEKNPAKTLSLLNLIPNIKELKIFISGVGTSNLVEELLNFETSLILNDISQEVILKLQNRIGDKNQNIQYLCHDVSIPFETNFDMVDVWVDRAVLHFLNSEKEITGYFDNLKSTLNPGGYVFIAEFSKVGVTMCAGLNVHLYSVDEISVRLGPGFSLIKSFEYIYLNPSGGERPYIYTLFRRNP